MRKLQLCAAALVLAACASDSSELSDEARKGKGHGSTSTTADAAVTSADAATTTPTTSSGTVSCYSEGAPSNACTLPTHCCFSNYSAQHNGSCSTSACTWGTIDCDGPEDCAAGQYCCANAVDGGGWMLACQSTSCGAPPLHEELCHDSASCSSGSCVNTLSVNWDLPRTLYVCR
jgi:hypothetical protein